MTTKRTELIPHTIESTGKVVFLRRVSITTLMMDLMQEYPKPKPPIQEVDIAGKKYAERNYAHPDYGKALAMWEEDIQTKIMMILVSGYVHVELTDNDKQDVKEYREKMDGIRDLPMQDKQVWLRNIAIQTDQDFTDILTAIRQSGQPTEEGIKAAADGFPGDTEQS